MVGNRSFRYCNLFIFKNYKIVMKKKYIKINKQMPDPWGYKIEYDKFFEYVDIPHPPKEFILQIEEIKKMPNKNTNLSSFYGSCVAPKKLQQWVNKFIPNNTEVRYHWMTNDLHVHVDYVRIECWNYILDLGGSNTYTCFYDNNFNVKEKHFIKPKQWHWLSVGNLHKACNLENIRYGITVSGKRGTRNYQC